MNAPTPAKNDKEGYEWFGGTAPPHEALTAYGLLQFRDMAHVREVDPAMLKRTQDYLHVAARRQGRLPAQSGAPSTRSAGLPTTSPTPTSSGP